jgi:hypothetical protein
MIRTDRDIPIFTEFLCDTSNLLEFASSGVIDGLESLLVSSWISPNPRPPFVIRVWNFVSTLTISERWCNIHSEITELDAHYVPVNTDL